MKESIVEFAKDAIDVINLHLDLNDMSKDEAQDIEHNGWYYHLRKNTSFKAIASEIIITRRNYRPSHYEDQPEGNHIVETAWIYKEGMSCSLLTKIDTGYKIDGYIIHHYNKQILRRGKRYAF